MINLVNKILSLFILIVLAPLILLFFLLIRLTTQGPFIFKQRRAGKNRRSFTLYKIRTMVANAEEQKSRIKNLNEADGPVFKIQNDPRYTKIGRFLAHNGLDEIPQLVNIIKGEMAFVGPRPLPVEEAKKVSKKYERRFSVLPGVTSLWVIRGTDHSSFKRWMEYDLEYVKNKNFLYELKIIIKTIWMLLKQFI